MGAGEPTGSPAPTASLHLDDVTHRYGGVAALDHVSLDIEAGRIHAVLGPNGAGKTTLLRVVAGLQTPNEGDVWFDVDGTPESAGWDARHLVGLVPSGERTFYLRLSGLENLVFFARLEGLRKREATRRALELIEQVGLNDAATRRVGLYSQGMRQRLSVARALVGRPPVLLVDEATHDLDPDGARQVRGLIREAASRGAVVLWTTQRLEEIRGFADTVTVLDAGRVRFDGTVDQLVARSGSTRHVVRLRGPASRLNSLAGALAGIAALEPTEDDEHHVLALHAGSVLGDALATIQGHGVDVLGCHRERPEVEDAFVTLVGSRS